MQTVDHVAALRIASRIAAQCSWSRVSSVGLDLGLGDRHVHPLAVVLDRDDVRVLLREQREQLDQLARPVPMRVRTTR